MTGIILSGGNNTRMGTNKAFLKIGGEKLLDRTIRVFREIFQEIILVTNSPLEYLDYDIRTVTDIIKGKAALGGIYTGLFHASHTHAFVSPCDMPFLNGDFIKFMVEKIENYDIVVPQATGGLEALHAIYSKRCMPVIKRHMEKGNLKINTIYKKSKTLILAQETVVSFDPEEHMFLNINSPDDLEKLRRSSVF
ncbi:MAG: molybdenum cofactor guanylyltransferase [Deltaproteobacteria bacterium]|nr:molybdenum cofactor guanylyltransferase [Deltaproteobacteria bacterium]